MGQPMKRPTVLPMAQIIGRGVGLSASDSRTIDLPDDAAAAVRSDGNSPLERDGCASLSPNADCRKVDIRSCNGRTADFDA
jgi:hypothetical protein